MTMQYITKCVATLAQALTITLMPILLYHKQATNPGYHKCFPVNDHLQYSCPLEGFTISGNINHQPSVS